MKISKKTKFKPAKMVNWFSPSILLQSALKSVISKLFGNYADRREMQAAITKNEDSKNNYFEKEELWIDFLSDTGDGFNSTFSMAKLLAEEILTVKYKNKEFATKRSDILILGGDQIYPTPTAHIYSRKFQIPFSCALPQFEEKEASKTNNTRIIPHLYAIPGNHDWYDGLGNFIKIFCQQRSIGRWKTCQHRSYFAIKIRNNTWIWATDIQLNADIDQPQLAYFCDVARSKMSKADNVILITAEPAWVYKELYKNDRSYERLNFFVRRYITEDAAGLIGYTFCLKAILTGDLHHYSRYAGQGSKTLTQHFLGAGGGGAFMHLTHVIPSKLHGANPKDKDEFLEADVSDKEVYGIRKTIFPSETASKSLNFMNLLFPFINRGFGVFMGCIYFLFYWIIYATNYEEKSKDTFTQIVYTFNKSMGFSLLLTIIVLAFYSFTDVRSRKIISRVVGCIHALLQGFMILFIINTFMLLNAEKSIFLLVSLEIFISGWLLSGCIFGTYLFCCCYLRMHIDEVSSSLSWSGYKNFIRMHIDDSKLTIYPIGIKTVNKKWDIQQKNRLIISGSLPKYELIENPIEILL